MTIAEERVIFEELKSRFHILALQGWEFGDISFINGQYKIRTFKGWTEFGSRKRDRGKRSLWFSTNNSCTRFHYSNLMIFSRGKVEGKQIVIEHYEEDSWNKFIEENSIDLKSLSGAAQEITECLTKKAAGLPS